MIKTWNKTIYFPPAILYKDDLNELYLIISESRNKEYLVTRITIRNGEHSSTFSSVEELFAEASNIKVKELTITTSEKNKDYARINNIDIYMYSFSISCEISSENETWYLGKIAQITNYFSERRRWYHRIWLLRYSFSLLFVAGLIVSTFSAIDKDYNALYYSVIPTAIFAILDSKLKIFSHSTIIISEKEKTKISQSLIGNILTAIAIIVAIIIGIYQYKSH